jgi:hypothetical protein
MRDTLKVFRAGRRIVIAMAALIVAVLSSAAVSSAAVADGAGVVPWGGSLTDVYFGGNNDALTDVTVFMGEISLPAGQYHLSGKVSVANSTLYDRDVSCRVYGRAEGDYQNTAIDDTGGLLPASTEWDLTIGTPPPTFVGGFSTIFKLNAPGRVWAECTGGDTGQPPWNGVEEKTKPQYPEIEVFFMATTMGSRS